MTVDLKAKIEEFVKANRKVWPKRYRYYTFIKESLPEGHKLYNAWVHYRWEGESESISMGLIPAPSPEAAKQIALAEAREVCLATRLHVNVYEEKNVIDLSLSNV